MDWSSFPSDVVAGLIGTAAGLLAGLRIDQWAAHRRTRTQEGRRVQSLINTLASKRAFSHSDDVGPIDDEEDRERCIQSVLDARRRAADLCDAIELRIDLLPALRGIEVDCLDYLNYVETQPRLYAVGLVKLRQRIGVRERELGQLVPELVLLPPGTHGLRLADWLE